MESMLLEVRPSNTRALEIYERYGFKHIGRRKGYYPAANGQREDALVMRFAMSAMDKRSAIFLDEMGIGVQWQLRQRPAAPAAGELPAEAEPLADAAQDDIAPPTMEAAELPGPEHLAATAAAPAAATAAVNRQRRRKL
jgi:hypothetical protein